MRAAGLLLFVAFSAGCGRSPLSVPDAGQDAGEPCPFASVGRECGIEPLLDPAALCLSPRRDPEAEWLAIEAGRTFLADQQLYERAHRELADIRARWDAGVSVRARPPFASGLIIQGGDPNALVADPSFNCFLRTYRGRATAVPSSFLPWTEVEFEGVLDVRKLIPEVERISRVATYTNSLLGDGPDICCSVDDAGVATWIFDDAGGDCPSGCTEHHYTGFSSSPDGTLSHLGTWPEGMPRPAWFSNARACADNL